MTSLRAPAPDTDVHWFRQLNGYHWYVFVLAAFGWLFDTMDQQLFVTSKALTMKDFFPHASFEVQTYWGGLATTIFILGWATGGLFFGMMGDKWGRAKTMAVTIFVYAVFTGASGLVHGGTSATVCRIPPRIRAAPDWVVPDGYLEFAVFRFLTGLGVGGEFAVGAALVAEVMPEKARSHALGMLQALSAFGNVLGAFLLGVVATSAWGWRGLYYIGALPALLAVFVFARLKEPEKWVKAREAARNHPHDKTKQFGRISDLFTDRLLRRNTFVGLALALAGVVGIWGVAFWSPELIETVVPTVTAVNKPKIEAVLAAPDPAAQTAAAQALDEPAKKALLKLWTLSAGGVKATPAVLDQPLPPEHKARIAALLAKSLPEHDKTRLKSRAMMLQQVGAFLGIFAFTVLAHYLGRRASFLISFVLAWGAVLLTFGTFKEEWQIWYLWPILGFGTLACFGGLRHLSAGTLSHAAAHHRHRVLLQRRPLSLRARPADARAARDQPAGQPVWHPRPAPGGDDCRVDLFPGHLRAHLGARNRRPAAARRRARPGALSRRCAPPLRPAGMPSGFRSAAKREAARLSGTMRQLFWLSLTLPPRESSPAASANFRTELMETKIASDAAMEKLELLQKAHPERGWTSLDSRCMCILCERTFSGHEVRMVETATGEYRLLCPTRGCNSTPDEWVHPGNPLLSDEAWQDWLRLVDSHEPESGKWSPLGQDRRRSRFTRMAD